MTELGIKSGSGSDVELPSELAAMPIERLNLSVRCYHALNAGGVDTIGKIVCLSDQKLLRFHALGTKSLAEIREAVAKILSTHAGPQGASHEAMPDLSQSKTYPPQALIRGGWKVPPHCDEELDISIDRLDLSTRSSKMLAYLELHSLRQLINYPKQKLSTAENIGRKSIHEIERKMFAYLARRRNVGALAVGDLPNVDALHHPVGIKDVVSHMLSLLLKRQRNILSDRYGLWDGMAETLQDIGDKLGLTREAIRGIESKGINRIRRLFAYEVIRNFVRENIYFYLESRETDKLGVVNEDEAIEALAIGCTPEEAGLAIEFLQDIDLPGGSLFARTLIEIEPEVYCLNEKVASDYKQLLNLIEVSLRHHQEPLEGSTLFSDIALQTDAALTADQLNLANRILAVSPTVSRLRNGTIVMYGWKEFRGHGASHLAETALRLLGRPSHVDEIVQKVAGICGETRMPGKRAIHNALITERGKFVWVKSSTYGLTAWGLKSPPSIKDRLVELLSEALCPLPFRHLKRKVLEVCNCRDDSVVRMTLDSNIRLFKRFEGDQYGLRNLLWHYEK